MKHVLLSLIISVFYTLTLNAQINAEAAYYAEDAGYFITPVETPYGIVFTDNYASQIYLLNNGKTEILAESPGCGRYFSVSPDGRYVSYKAINEKGEQAAAYIDLEKQEKKRANYSENCSQITINRPKTKQRLFEISNLKSHHSNLTPISPDGKYLVYDRNQKYFNLLNLQTGEETRLPNDNKGVIYPKWSPDGKKILYQNRKMELLVCDIEKNKLYKIGKGGAGNWSPDSESIVFHRKDADPVNFVFKSSEIFISDYKGRNIRQITHSPGVFEMTPSFGLDGKSILYQTYNKRQIVKAELNSSKSGVVSNEILLDNPKSLKPKFYDTSKFLKSKSITHLTKDVPYIHQKYDAPTGRNGGSACAPTTSVMALAYYNRLPKWPVEATTYTWLTGKTSHDYSGYVLDRYKYNEHSFDAYSSSKNAYGGYAYMWVSPYSSPGSGGMPNYQDHHDMASDWFTWTVNAHFSLTTTEIDNEYPHPICSWITHSGHLTLAVGYVNGQHTVIFNDPWGDKNTPGYPSYDGKDAYYDWPGYNNGYQNLDPDGSHGTVAWVIDAQSSEQTYDPLHINNIDYDNGFYINNSEDGATQRYYRHVKDAAGSSGHIWWTGGEGGASSDICWVKWTPTIPAEADYQVEVYIPANFTDSYSSAAVTSSARYKIYYDGGNTSVSVDQDANKGSWVNLGTYRFAAGETGYVRLGDAVNSADNGKKVLFDAVKFTQVSVPFQVDISHVKCKGDNDGTATVSSVPGTAPYTYTWSHDAGLTGNTATGLAPGNYSVTAENQESETYTENFTINEADAALSLSATLTHPTTVGGSNGSITANVSGGETPYSYTWSHDAGNNTNFADNLSAGTYNISVSDAYGCSLNEDATLLDPDCCTLLSADFSTGLPNDWTNIDESGSNPDYVWRFDNPAGRPTGGNFNGDFAILDADYIYANITTGSADASMTTKAIDCTGKNNVMLKFDHKFIHSGNTADAILEVSNNGTSWTTLQTWATASAGPEELSYDISAYAADEATVYIRWAYTDRTAYSNYWAIDNVEVYAPLSGSYLVKSDGSGDYGSLSDAINDLNYCGVGTGGVTFLLPAGEIYEEELPTITASGTSGQPVVFRKDGSGANPIIKSSGSTGTEAAVALAGGDYFTFDGIDIQASTNSLEYGFHLYNVSATDGAQNNTIENCSITLDRSNESSKGIYQDIQTGSINPTSASGANSFNTYQNLSISNVYHGIDLFGYDLAGQDALYDDGCEVRNCEIYDFGLTGAVSDRATGILTWSQKNLSVHDNLVHDGTSGDRTLGIYCAGNNTGEIFSNTVYGLYGEGIQVVGLRQYESDMQFYLNEVYDIEGIDMASGIEGFGGTSSVYNNLVYDIKAPSGNSTANGYPSARGISFRYTSGTQSVYYNTVYISYTSANAGNESTGLYVENSIVDLRNNIFENNSLATTGTRANVLYFQGANDIANVAANTDNNCYYNGIANTKYALVYDAGNAVSYLDLSAYQAVSPGDANSIEENPPFKRVSSPYDLHIDPTQTTGISNGGVPVPGITSDFDGDTRDAATPDIGADEYSVAGALCGNYTIDNTIATGGTNFNNFTDALNALNDRGVSCAVIFEVTDGQIFTEDPPAIIASGTSVNTIRFVKSGTGANPVLQATGTAAEDDFGFKLIGCDYYTFSGIDIQISGGDALEYGFYITNFTDTDGAQHNTIQDCSITLNKSNSNSVGIYQKIDESIAPSTADGANSFNTYSNVSIQNVYHGFNLFGYDVSGQEPLYDDAAEIVNCSVNDFGGQRFRAAGVLTWSQKNLIIQNNTISNGSSPSYGDGNDGRCLGIYTAGNNSGDVRNNIVFGLQGVGSQVAGLRAYESSVDFYNNTVYDIQGEDMASGIEIYGGTAYIYNNFVRDIRTPNEESYGHPTARGISNRTGTAYIYNNSILLNYISTVATNESAGIFTEGFYGANAESDIRNNIVLNKTDISSNGGTVAAALYKSADYSTISGNSDNNLYYAGTPSSKNLIFYDTNVGYQTLADYKTFCSTYEQNSITENAPFVSPSDLHIQTSAISLIDGGGQVIATVSDDIDGDTRDAAIPDIGADEYECDYIVWRGTTDTDWATATNWRKRQIPTSSDDVVIPNVSSESNNFPVIASTAETNDLKIASGAHLQVNPNFSLSVNGLADNQAGITGLILKSDASGTASFINGTPDVPASVERYLAGTQWHYITAPVQDAPLSLFNTNNFLYYDESVADSWSGGIFNSSETGWTDYTNPNLTSMQGYAYYYYTTTLAFTGNLHTGTYSSPALSWTDTPEDDSYEGWHLLGNPYPSAIDFSESNILSSDIILNNVDKSVYFYDGQAENYKGYNTISGGINGGTQYIPAMQGFFVHATADGASFEVNNNARVHNTTAFYKNPKSEPDYISLLASANGYSDEIKLIENPDASFAFDGEFDLYKMYSRNENVPQIFLINEDVGFALNAIPYFSEEQVFPVGFKAGNFSFYEIRLNESNLDTDIYLKDNLSNSYQNITDNPVYSFMHNENVSFNRFEIHLSQPTSGSELSADGICIFPNPSEGKLFIKLPVAEADDASLSIYDISGKLIKKKTLISTINELDLSMLEKGIYFVKISGQNKTHTQKIILK